MLSSLSSLPLRLRALRDAILPDGASVSSISIIDMLAHNWYLGFSSFGGPAVHFSIFRRLFVEDYKWLDETAYQEMFALCQALSGPGSTKMLYAINLIHYGFWTGLAAFFVWSLPMAIVAFGLSLGVSQIGAKLPEPVYALLSGLNSATVGIIALAAYQLSQKAITDRISRILVFLGAAAGMLYNALWYFPLIMVVGGTTATVHDLRLLQRLWQSLRLNREMGAGEDSHEPRSTPESQTQNDRRGRAATLYLDSSVQPSHGHEETSAVTASRSRLTGSWKYGTIIIAAFLVVFIVVMALRGTIGGQRLAFDVFVNFFLAGTIIFGGGPVVIPLLRAYVVSPGWVSPRDFLLGLAITQAFPGPNFNFAVYLGALAISGSGLHPVVGAIIGFLGIFTPGLWLHTGTMGLWSSVRKLQAIRACLRGIHAAAVGLVFTAVYRLFESGFLDKNVQNGGSLGRDPWWVVIIATSFVGGLHFRLSPPLAVVLGSAMGLVQYGVSRA